MKSVLIISNDIDYITKIEKRVSLNRFKVLNVQTFDALIEEVSNKSIDIAILDASDESLEAVSLKLLMEKFPEILRFSVSDFNTSNEFHLAKKESSARLQCSKSLSIDELFILIEKVVQIDEQVKDKGLINLMASLKNLPTVPKVYFEMSKMIEENASVDEISARIEEDPAITSNILKLANTAFYNAKTGSIRQAIMYVGLLNVKNIILTNAVFGNNGLDPRARDLHWQHVKLTNRLLSAFYSEMLGRKLNNNISSVGLLHDIGTIVLMSNFPDAFNRLYQKLTESPTQNFSALEAEIIGFNHEKVGGYLLDLWGLPLPIIESALWHHDPFNECIINKELVQAVHLCNHYAWKASNVKRSDNHLNEGVFASLGITKEGFDVFYKRFTKK